MLDPTFRTSQEYLNLKAGFTGPLRTKQECWQALSGYTSTVNATLSTGTMCSAYCGGSGSQQNRMNFKAGESGNTLTRQEAIRRF